MEVGAVHAVPIANQLGNGSLLVIIALLVHVADASALARLVEYRRALSVANDVKARKRAIPAPHVADEAETHAHAADATLPISSSVAVVLVHHTLVAVDQMHGDRNRTRAAHWEKRAEK